jgi:hypothetical protein
MACVFVFLVAGCDALIGLLPTAQTRVELVNNGDFPVEVELFYDNEQDIPESLLTTDAGTRVVFNVGVGETSSFSRDCDDLQAIIVSDADLLIIGGIGPEASSNVLRDGDDFGCGDTIVFTFDHSNLLVDFDVSSSVHSGTAGGQ